jgi:hypothetical protein
MSFDLDNGHAPVVLDIAGTKLHADDRRREGEGQCQAHDPQGFPHTVTFRQMPPCCKENVPLLDSTSSL